MLLLSTVPSVHVGRLKVGMVKEGVAPRGLPWDPEVTVNLKI